MWAKNLHFLFLLSARRFVAKYFFDKFVLRIYRNVINLINNKKTFMLSDNIPTDVYLQRILDEFRPLGFTREIELPESVAMLVLKTISTNVFRFAHRVGTPLTPLGKQLFITVSGKPRVVPKCLFDKFLLDCCQKIGLPVWQFDHLIKCIN